MLQVSGWSRKEVKGKRQSLESMPNAASSEPSKGYPPCHVQTLKGQRLRPPAHVCVAADPGQAGITSRGAAARGDALVAPILQVGDTLRGTWEQQSARASQPPSDKGAGGWPPGHPESSFCGTWLTGWQVPTALR